MPHAHHHHYHSGAKENTGTVKPNARERLISKILAFVLLMLLALYFIFPESLPDAYEWTSEYWSEYWEELSYDPADFPMPQRPEIIKRPPEPMEFSSRNLYEIMESWNPDVVDIPLDFTETIQTFDFEDPEEFAIAMRYRDAEIPFKLFNVPEVMKVSTLWTDEYLIEQIGDTGNVEISKDNHFLFAKEKKSTPKDYKKPTRIVGNIKFADWVQMAKDADDKQLKNDTKHYYFMLNNNDWNKKEDEEVSQPGGGPGMGGGGRFPLAGRGRGGGGRNSLQDQQQQESEQQHGKSMRGPAPGDVHAGRGGTSGRQSQRSGEDYAISSHRNNHRRRVLMEAFNISASPEDKVKKQRRLNADLSPPNGESRGGGGGGGPSSVGSPGGGPGRGRGRGRGGNSRSGPPSGAKTPKNEVGKFITRDLPTFSTFESNWVKKEPSVINCRWGMRGIIAESHFDGGENFVVMLRGSKRYVISPPETCKHLGIVTDRDHPSARQSVLDWGDLAQARANGFDKVPAIDTVMHAGQVLFIPSLWFHYIVSLEYSIQCNTRNGKPENSVIFHHMDETCGGNYDAKERQKSEEKTKKEEAKKKIDIKKRSKN